MKKIWPILVSFALVVANSTVLAAADSNRGDQVKGAVKLASPPSAATHHNGKRAPHGKVARKAPAKARASQKYPRGSSSKTAKTTKGTKQRR